MNLYFYRVKDKQGRNISGFIRATGKVRAAALLQEKDYYVVDLLHVMGSLSIPFFKVGPRDLAVYCRQLATMISAGVPILTALTALGSQRENKMLAGASQKLVAQLKEGNMLAEAMEQMPRIFPALFRGTVRAGELSGTLDKSLDLLAVHYEHEHQFREKIKSALAYPSLVFLLSIASILVSLNFVLPQMASVFTSHGVILPFPTRVVLTLSNFLRSYWEILLVGLPILLGSLVLLAGKKEGRRLIDGILLQIPVVGKLARKSIIARFARAMSILLNSGIPVLQALEIMQQVLPNSVAIEIIGRVKSGVQAGRGISKQLDACGFFPPLLIQMVKVGEETGALDSMLQQAATYYEKDVTLFTDRTVKLLEPLLVILTAGVVGIVVSSVLLPVVTLTGLF